MANQQRLFSLDAIRGFAILDMIVIHFVVYWSPPEGSGLWVQESLNHLTGADFGAAGFLILAGMGQVLSQKSRPRPAVVALRGLGLFIVGLLLLLLAWGPGNLWEWDILTLMGAFVILYLALRAAPSWLLLLLCLATALVSPWLRQGIDSTHFWGGPLEAVPGLNDLFPGLLWDPPARYVSHWNLGDILRGFLVMGAFPVFPWIIHPILGMALGRMHLAGRLGPACLRLALTGLALTLTGLALAFMASSRGTLSHHRLPGPLELLPGQFHHGACANRLVPDHPPYLLLFPGLQGQSRGPGRAHGPLSGAGGPGILEHIFHPLPAHSLAPAAGLLAGRPQPGGAFRLGLDGPGRGPGGGDRHAAPAGRLGRARVPLRAGMVHGPGHRKGPPLIPPRRCLHELSLGLGTLPV